MDELMAEIQVPRDESSLIMVIGVGGAGCNAVSNMWHAGVKGVTYLACNTDRKSLNINPVSNKVRLGTEGLGAGNRPERGRDAAIASLEDIRRYLMESGCRMVFITAGMGGGTGTGAAPVVAEIARELGILTVAVVTKPFAFEGARKLKQAEKGIENLLANVDSLIVIPNQKLLTGKENLTMRQSFALADDILKTAVLSVTELILRNGEINVDFADVKTIMSNAGYAHMAIGHGEGKDKVADAVAQVISSPLLETSIKGAKRLLLNITMSDDIIAGDVAELTDTITKAAAEDVELIFGTSFNEELSDTIDVIVIASDFDAYSAPNEDGEAENASSSEPSQESAEDSGSFYDGLWKNLFQN